MAGFLKTPQEKLRTKINNMISSDLTEDNGEIKIGNDVLLSFNDAIVNYTSKRYFPTQINSIVEEDYTVSIPVKHANLKYISGSNPPKFCRFIISLFRGLNNPGLISITVGAENNNIEGTNLNITQQLYDDFVKINSEEGRSKAARVRNRMRPFLSQNYNVDLPEVAIAKDYGLLLREVINSGQINQEDVIELSSGLEEGNTTQVVIEKQVNKQAKWLIETIEEILDEDSLTKQKAKDFGNTHFGFLKTKISGPEHLMEMILSKFGQFTLFGVPALLNTDKYIVHVGNLSRSQFDIILITHLGEVEVVELKRPDKVLLDYDSSRNKFYPSKDLSIAISQSERYITAVIKDNDDDFTIYGKKVRQYLNDELGGTMFVETVRPTASIIMGSYKTISKSYDDLSISVKAKVTKAVYDDNSERAYRELKGAFKNINILTYSELLNHARTRLEILNEADSQQVTD